MTYPTKDPERVSCKKCLKILERDFVRVVVFGENPVLARVLKRDAAGAACVAVDASGTVYLEAEHEFLSAIAAKSKAAANG